MIFLPFEHRPFELVDLGLRDEEVAVGAGERAEHQRLVGGLAVVDVHRHFGAGETEVAAVRQNKRADAVAATGTDQLDLKALLLHVAFAERDIHRRVELRAQDFADLDLGLRACGAQTARQRGGTDRCNRRTSRQHVAVLLSLAAVGADDVSKDQATERVTKSAAFSSMPKRANLGLV